MTLETGTVYFFEQGEAELPEAVSLFGFPVSLYGICMVLAAVVGVLVSLREGRKRNQDKELTLTLLWITILSALVGARLYYAVFQWYPFSGNPFLVLNLRSGGFAYFGALFGAWPVVKWYCLRKSEDFDRAADVLCTGAAAAAVPVWLGCVFTREPAGRFYDGIFSIRIGTEYLPQEADNSLLRELWDKADKIEGRLYSSMHPVALYGLLAALLILAGVFIAKHVIKQSGNLFLWYLLFNSAACLVLEPFRASRCCIWGTEIPINMLVAAVLLLALLAAEIRYWLRQKNRKHG